jgi:hypothetical protein
MMVPGGFSMFPQEGTELLMDFNFYHLMGGSSFGKVRRFLENHSLSFERSGVVKPRHFSQNWNRPTCGATEMAMTQCDGV